MHQMNVDAWDLIASSACSGQADYSSQAYSEGLSDTSSSTPSSSTSSASSDGYVAIDFGKSECSSADPATAPAASILESSAIEIQEGTTREDHSDDKPQSKEGLNGLKVKKDAARKVQLPPCRVCGGVSSGCHFGVITCESCKVFFRRSLTKEPTYFCGRKESCEIISGQKSNCSFCRLKKCEEMGMSKDGVKKGRYTLQRKYGYKVMVEKLEHKEKERKEEEERKNEMHQQLIRDTTDRLLQLHDRHRLITPEVLERIKVGQQKRLDYLKAVEETLGPTPPISPDEAIEFYQATGIDITGYRDTAKPCAEKCPQYQIPKVVNYLKDLEEFMLLSMPDRIATFKGTVNTWLWVSSFESVNPEELLVSCASCGSCFSEDQWRFFCKKEENERYFRPSKKLQELNLIDEERALLRAFVVFDTSQCSHELQEPEKVDSYQELFLECFMSVLEGNRGKAKASQAFAHIIDALTENRSHMHDTKEYWDKMIVVMGDVKYSKVIGEIFDIPDALVNDIDAGLSSLQL